MVLPLKDALRITQATVAQIGELPHCLEVDKGHRRVIFRQEQLTGTFETLLATPTATGTLQLGSVSYTLLMVPVRATILLGAIAIGFGLGFHASGVGPHRRCRRARAAMRRAIARRTRDTPAETGENAVARYHYSYRRTPPAT